MRAPFCTRYRALFVGIRGDQAGIDGKAFSTDKTLYQAALNHRLEQMPKDIALPETSVAVLREAGMIRHLAVQSKPAKQTIGEIEMNLLARY